jgi:hypothetical protein
MTPQRARQVFIRAAMFGVALTALGCTPDNARPSPTDYPNQPGGNPLVPEVAGYPFPSDFYLVEDSSTRTGRRVELPDAALETPKLAAALGGADGFSWIPLIVTYLPGGVAASSAGADAVLLVRIGSWARVPVVVETDLTEPDPERRALIIRPLVALEADAGYVVILGDTLVDVRGRAHRAGAAFAALRDGTPTGVEAIERQRGDFEQVTAALAALELDPDRVVQAWSFHTRSEEALLRALLAMQDHASAAKLGGYTITSDRVETTGGRTNRQIVGTFEAPDFIGDDGLIRRGADGTPSPSGRRDVEFRLTVPSTVDVPRPMLLFGHGIFGSPAELTHGSFNDLCTEHRFSAIGGHIGLNERNQALALVALTAEPERLAQLAADIQQGMVDYTTLARLVKERLVDDLTRDDGQGPVKLIDPTRVAFMGISNGGNIGFGVAATTPKLGRAVLVAGGGGLIHNLERVSLWASLGPVVKLAYPDSRERQLVLSLLQQALDPFDAMTFARHLVRDRLPGRGPLRVAVHMAVHDSAVSNMITEWVVRTAGLPLVTPAPKAIPGLQALPAPPPAGAPDAPGALFVYDQKVEPNPSGNLPPSRDNGTHEAFRELDAYKRQVAAFVESGKLVQLCTGACDPD